MSNSSNGSGPGFIDTVVWGAGRGAVTWGTAGMGVGKWLGPKKAVAGGIGGFFLGGIGGGANAALDYAGTHLVHRGWVFFQPSRRGYKEHNASVDCLRKGIEDFFFILLQSQPVDIFRYSRQASQKCMIFPRPVQDVYPGRAEGKMKKWEVDIKAGL